MCEQVGVSSLTGKRVKKDSDSAIIECHLFWNYLCGFDDFPILVSNNNDFNSLMESLLINGDHSLTLPPLNKNRQSLHLELFDNEGTIFYHISHSLIQLQLFDTS